jgi:thioredoxin
MIEGNDANFESILEDIHIKPVVVDFWAPWCQPCKIMAPAFEQLASEFSDQVTFVKVNIDETQLAMNYGVRGIPAFVFFKKDGSKAMTAGVKSLEDLRDWIKQNLE